MDQEVGEIFWLQFDILEKDKMNDYTLEVSN